MLAGAFSCPAAHWKETRTSMRWLTRLAISVMCLGFGASAWLILAQKRSAPDGSAKAAEVTTATSAPVEATKAELQNDVLSSIRFAPPKPAHAMLNVKTLVLRESAAANSRVVAKVKIDGSYYIDILD